MRERIENALRASARPSLSSRRVDHQRLRRREDGGSSSSKRVSREGGVHQQGFGLCAE
jgi:hypothetical protein